MKFEGIYTPVVTPHTDSFDIDHQGFEQVINMLICLLYTSPSPRDKRQSRMPSSA